MEIKVKNWKISRLIKKKDLINDQPEYQRGQVWSSQKEALLIDSILRGIDIPKIYLRVINNKIHEYEVADGQQRLNAIYNFINGDLKLLDKTIKGLLMGKIDSFDVGKMTFDEIPDILKNRFKDFEITISEITNCNENEVRVLFGRLQEGVTLNPAEKRNSIISTVGKHIESITLNHTFFINCKISKKRFKHQEYLAHVFGLIFYNNQEDLKSNLLEKMYLDTNIKVDNNLLKKIDNVLDNIYAIDSYGGKPIKNKYTFIDIFWLLFNQLPKKSINTKDFRKSFDKFESDRLKYRKDLNSLSKKKDVYSENLYDYILAYDRSGALTNNINTRKNVFLNIFSQYIF